MSSLWLEGGWKSKSAGLAGAAKTWRLGFQCHLQASLAEENAGGLTTRMSLACSPATTLFFGGMKISLCKKFSILEGFFLGYWLAMYWWIYTCRYKYTRFLKRCSLKIYNFFLIKEVMHDKCIFHIEITLHFYSTKVKQRLDVSYCAVPFSS